MPFTDLISRKVGECDGKTIWELHEPLEWTNGIKKVFVPIKFQCDFASVPRLPLAYLVVGGMGEIAGTVHDYLYRDEAVVIEDHEIRRPTREEADDIFRIILGEEGVSWWKRYAMWKAVRVGAGSHWQKRKVMEPFIKEYCL